MGKNKPDKPKIHLERRLEMKQIKMLILWFVFGVRIIILGLPQWLSG